MTSPTDATASPDRSTASSAPRPAAPEVSVRQLTLGGILGTWAAATVPMGLLAWVGAPWLADQPGWTAGLPGALILALTLGLTWQLVLVLVLVRRELGTLRWGEVREALWLRAPRRPSTGIRGGRTWWVLVPLVVGLVATQAIPLLPHPDDRDLGVFLGSDAGTELFAGAWHWFALVVVLLVMNTVLGEELLFRGYLLPRMEGVLGRRAWLGNGVLFALYHVHTPWSMPMVLATTFVFAWPAQRYRSAVLPILVHSVQSVLMIGLVLAVVLS